MPSCSAYSAKRASPSRSRGACASPLALRLRFACASPLALRLRFACASLALRLRFACASLALRLRSARLLEPVLCVFALIVCGRPHTNDADTHMGECGHECACGCVPGPGEALAHGRARQRCHFAQFSHKVAPRPTSGTGMPVPLVIGGAISCREGRCEGEAGMNVCSAAERERGA